MKLKLIVVAPKYQMNIGYIARISKNFGIGKLSFVRPRANVTGKKAIMFSKHGVDLLESSKTFDSLEEATRGCDAIIGTTGIWRNDDRFDREYTLEKAIATVEKQYSGNATIALVLGRDDKGLNREELELCDMVLHIPSNPEYPSLNISHALAILLYAFKNSDFTGYQATKAEESRKEEYAILMAVFDKMIKGKSIRDKRSVRNIFAKAMRRAQLNRNEMHAIITALK